MFCFGILRILGGNLKKEENYKNLGIIELLRRSVGIPRRGVDLHQGVGYPCCGEAEVPKWHPTGTLR